MSSFKVIIIGGGLAGSLLANGLLLHDIDCMVYERDAKNSNRSGYQIRLGAPALIGFRACLPKERMDLLMKKFGRSGGMISSAPILYDEKLNELLDLTKFPAYTKSAPINRVILRNYLSEPIYEAGKFQYGKKFTSYETIQTKEGEKIRVHFEDGTSDEGDLVISAEGSSSRINTKIGLNNIVQLDKNWGFLAKGNLPPSKLRSLAPECQKSPLSCLKDRKRIFFSAYLPDKQEGQDLDPSIEYDVNAASVFWGLSVPAELVPSGGAKDIPDKLAFCIDMIKDWDPRYHDMMRLIGEDDIYVFQARSSTPPSKNWRKAARKNKGYSIDRVWLMGDAIHPMLPSRGMGANQAMNDTAEALPEIIALADIAKSGKAPTENDIAIAVDNYERKMMPRAFGWVKTSGGLGQEMPEPDSFRGKLGLFFISRLLDIAFLVSLIRRALGFRPPQDDAPELPN